MALSFNRQNDVGIVTVHSPMTAATADAFREDFINWLKDEEGLKRVVVDLGEVDLMDSAGLGALMAVLKRVSEDGGNMCIARLQKKPRMVFELTRAYKVFDVYDGVEEAVAVPF